MIPTQRAQQMGNSLDTSRITLNIKGLKCFLLLPCLFVSFRQIKQFSMKNGGVKKLFLPISQYFSSKFGRFSWKFQNFAVGSVIFSENRQKGRFEKKTFPTCPEHIFFLLRTFGWTVFDQREGTPKVLQRQMRASLWFLTSWIHWQCKRTVQLEPAVLSAMDENMLLMRMQEEEWTLAGKTFQLGTKSF